MMLSANAGFLLSFVAGNYLKYHEIPFIGLAISIVYLLAFIFFPETPQFLLKSKKEEVRNTYTSHGGIEKKLFTQCCFSVGGEIISILSKYRFGYGTH